MEPMSISLREARLVLERLMHVARLPAGLVPSARDAALYSAMLGLGGFPALLRHLELLRGADLRRLRLGEAEDLLQLDAGGQHAWLVADAVVDLAGAALSHRPNSTLRVTNLLEAEELGIARLIGQRHGLALDLAHGVGAVEVQARRGEGETDVLAKVAHVGLAVEPSLWWALFDLSDQALAPDSVLSRRHAGAIIVGEDGVIIGREDEDETDLTMLVHEAVKVSAANRVTQKENEC